ncbi:unnamed protein product [Brassica oleracea]
MFFFKRFQATLMPATVNVTFCIGSHLPVLIMFYTYLLIVQTLLVGEDHSDNDMTWAVNLSVESNPIVNNIGLDNTNRCDASATMEGCLEVSEPIPTQTGPVVNTKEETMDEGDCKDPNLKKPRNALSLPLLANFFLNSISS